MTFAGSPEFHAAMRRYVDLVEGGRAGERVTALALKEVMKLAPPEFLDLCRKLLTAAGMKLPPPIGLDARGQRVYRLEDVADACGIPREEAIQAYDELGIEAPTVMMRAH